MKVRNYLYLVVSALMLLALSFFTGRWTHNCPPVPVKPDSTYTSVPDSIFVHDTVFVKVKFNPVIPDAVGEWDIANFDTTVVSEKDTITSKTMVKSSRRSKSILIEQEIDIRKTETIIHDTTFITKYEPKLVPVSVDRGLDTFYGGVLISSVIYLVLFIIFGG